MQIDAASNAVARTISTPGPIALAADAKGAVWVVTRGRLQRVTANGALQRDLDLAALGFRTEPAIAADRFDGSVWLADHERLVQVGESGALVRSFHRTASPVRRIAAGLDRSVWLLGTKELMRISPDGAPVAYDLRSKTLSEPKDLVLDDLGSAIWIAGEKDLTQLDAAGTGVKVQIRLPAVARATAVDARRSVLWVLAGDRAVAYDAAGSIAATIDLQANAIRNAVDVAFDPIADALWIGHDAGLARYSPAGTLVASLSGFRVDEVETAPFAIAPLLTLVSPQDGIVTSDAFLSSVVRYGAGCNGLPCTVPAGHLARYSMTATRNGTPIAFAFDPASGQAVLTPATRLAEGSNSFRAQVRDHFGSLSNVLEWRIESDTIPPSFTSISPADGSTSSTASITVTGETNEPALVTIENLSEFGGIGNNPLGTQFTFALTLNPGLNAIRLRAVDGAGNVAQTTLQISLTNMRISISSPQAGAQIDGDRVLVSGTFEGVPRAAITVNGVVAAIQADLFRALVPLQTGDNSIVAAIAAPSGGTATATVPVVSLRPSPIQIGVEPAAGVAPLTIVVRAASLAGVSIISHQFTPGGPGSPAAVVPDSGELLRFTYTQPGIYEAVLTVRDGDETSVTQPLLIHVYDAAQMEAMFQSIWSDVRSALIAGDVERALTWFTFSARDGYRRVFHDLGADMPSILSTFSPLQRVSVRADFAEYAINRTIGGENYIFFVHFVRGADGVWRLESM